MVVCILVDIECLENIEGPCVQEMRRKILATENRNEMCSSEDRVQMDHSDQTFSVTLVLRSDIPHPCDLVWRASDLLEPFNKGTGVGSVIVYEREKEEYVHSTHSPKAWF